MRAEPMSVLSGSTPRTDLPLPDILKAAFQADEIATFRGKAILQIHQGCTVNFRERDHNM
tara:strand:+ start:137 stop:316 length:180 start_codon:yes stop_codon:yes gene_type:complete